VFYQLNYPRTVSSGYVVATVGLVAPLGASGPSPGSVGALMGSLIKKRRKRMRKKKHKKMLKRTRWQRRAAGK
jgi:hypothetical protein